MHITACVRNALRMSVSVMNDFSTVEIFYELIRIYCKYLL